MDKERCPWSLSHPDYIEYHDKEWGVPLLGDDRAWFEFLILEGFQAGLSWLCVLKKREAFRECFENFDIEKIASFDHHKIKLLMGDARFIRNRLKIESTILNAQRVLELQRQQPLWEFFWQFTEGKPIINHCVTMATVPSQTALSDKISKELKTRGFKFVGSTIIYALMQATGMVNDHLVSCYRYQELGG